MSNTEGGLSYTQCDLCNIKVSVFDIIDVQKSTWKNEDLKNQLLKDKFDYLCIECWYKVTQETNISFTKEDINLIRQWFNSTQDHTHKDFLKKEDYILAEKIYTYLGFRVTNSIKKGLK